jgi:predicted nucleic-acid-binding protein
MKGVDTNILVRFFVRDDLQLTERAGQFVRARSPSDPGVVNHVVLCEFVWVLERSYRIPRQNIIEALDLVMRSERFKVADPEDVWFALQEYEDGADFADALIAKINLRLGCEHTATFDHKAARRPGFRAL